MISFRYPDRFKAQQVVAAVVTKFADSEFVTTEADLMAAPPLPHRTKEDCIGTGNELVDCIMAYQGNGFSKAIPPRRRKSAEFSTFWTPRVCRKRQCPPTAFQLAAVCRTLCRPVSGRSCVAAETDLYCGARSIALISA